MGSVTWLYPCQGWAENDVFTVDATPSDGDPLMHGTCVLSKAVGPTYGVAKKSDVVIVKLPILKDKSDPTATSLAGIVEGYRRIVQHVIANNKQGMAVVNNSNGGAQHPMLLAYIKRLIALDVVVVTASGNNAVSQK